MVGSYCLFSNTSVRNRTPDNWARKLGRSNVFRMSHRLPYYINNVEHGFFFDIKSDSRFRTDMIFSLQIAVWYHQ